MPQAGIHALVGAAVRKWSPNKEWLFLGILLGNMLPDFDNYAVAVATLAKWPSEGIHRTFSHSLLTVLAVYLVFLAIGAIAKLPRWANLGLGLAFGMVMHILLDLVAWFNGVQILWPIPSWINFWQGIQLPDWFERINNPAEFLFFGLYLMALRWLSQKHSTDADFQRMLNIWVIVLFVLFIVFLPLAFLMTKGFMTIYGAAYLFALTMAFAVTIRMRKTVEAA